MWRIPGGPALGFSDSHWPGFGTPPSGHSTASLPEICWAREVGARKHKQILHSMERVFFTERSQYRKNGFVEEDTLASDQRGILHKRRWENGILMRKKMAPPAFSYFAASLMSPQAAGGWQEDSGWDQLPEQRRNQNIRRHSGPGVLWERWLIQGHLSEPAGRAKFLEPSMPWLVDTTLPAQTGQQGNCPGGWARGWTFTHKPAKSLWAFP